MTILSMILYAGSSTERKKLFWNWEPGNPSFPRRSEETSGTRGTSKTAWRRLCTVCYPVILKKNCPGEHWTASVLQSLCLRTACWGKPERIWKRNCAGTIWSAKKRQTFVCLWGWKRQNCWKIFLMKADIVCMWGFRFVQVHACIVLLRLIRFRHTGSM